MFALLFDIDGTLVHTGGAGGTALLGAFSHAFSVAEPTRVPFSGRTDRWIGSQLFQVHGLEDSDENFGQLRDEYLRRLRVELPLKTGRVLPGVVRLLDELQQREDVALGLLTGNLRDGARLKLEHYRLYDRFSFGGFGDRHLDRGDVAREALVATREHLGRDLEPDRIWVIGDTPLDVACARTIGAKALAVATGWNERAELANSAPDLLLDTLEDPRPLLSQLNGQ